MNPTLRTSMLAATLALSPVVATAEDISTHVLDITAGVGAGDIPVTLEREESGEWASIGQSKTTENGRIEGFGIEASVGTYRLTFDMTGYEGFADRADTFFPTITVGFEVHDADRHHHVPVVVSGFGYSTYLGN